MAKQNSVSVEFVPRVLDRTQPLHNCGQHHRGPPTLLFKPKLPPSARPKRPYMASDTATPSPHTLDGFDSESDLTPLTDSDFSDSDDSDFSVVRQPSKKRRIAKPKKEKKEVVKASPKKLRGYKGVLQGLWALPLDVTYEVRFCVCPRRHLSDDREDIWTSATLRLASSFADEQEPSPDPSEPCLHVRLDESTREC